MAGNDLFSLDPRQSPASRTRKSAVNLVVKERFRNFRFPLGLNSQQKFLPFSLINTSSRPIVEIYLKIDYASETLLVFLIIDQF